MKLTLHIGTEKTGTTSIQAALAADRERLAEKGVLFPRLFGSPNHMELAVAATNPAPPDELQMIELGRQDCDLAEYRRRLAARIAEETQSGNFDRIVVSNEHCHSRLRDAEAIRRLIGLFGASPQDCEVIVYLRRQDRLAVSLHATVLQLGGKEALFRPQVAGALDHYFDFERVLDTYAQVLGPDRIRVRLYEPNGFQNGNVVSDFYAVAALGMAPSSTPRFNQSLSFSKAKFLRRFNAHFPILRDGRLNEERGRIFKVIQHVRPGPPFRPARAEAEAFYAPFREGNARVRARFLPDLDRSTLFDEDFSEYPETAPDWTLAEDEVFDFIAAIWRYRQSDQG